MAFVDFWGNRVQDNAFNVSFKLEITERENVIRIRVSDATRTLTLMQVELIGLN